MAKVGRPRSPMPRPDYTAPPSSRNYEPLNKQAKFRLPSGEKFVFHVASEAEARRLLVDQMVRYWTCQYGLLQQATKNDPT